MINNNLDKQQAVKRIQVKDKFLSFAIMDMREMIIKCDNALKCEKMTNSEDDKREFCHIQNCVHKEISKDKKNSITSQFNKAADNPRLIWGHSKDNIRMEEEPVSKYYQS